MAAADIHKQAHHAGTTAGVLQILGQHILLRCLQSLHALLHQLQRCSSNLLGAVIIQKTFGDGHIIMVSVELQHSLHLADDLVTLALDNISCGGQLTALDFSLHHTLDELQLAELTGSDKGHSHTGIARTTGTTDAVHVAFRVLRNIKVDNVGNIIHIDAAGSHVSSDEHIAGTLAEFFHHAIALILAQIAMQALGHVATAGQRDGQVIHTLFSAAEDNQLAIDFCIQQTAQALHLILSFKIILLD